MNEYNVWLQMLKNNKTDEEIDLFLSGNDKQIGNKTTSNSNITPILLPGGKRLSILGCYSRLFMSPPIGHFEVTSEVLQEYKSEIGETLINVIARASRLPDVIYFDNHQYHAQSKYNKEQIPIAPETCLKECSELLHTLTLSAKEHLEKKSFKDFAFFLGLSFHVVQDIAIHQGITGPEHAYLDAHNKSPDLNMKYIELAKMLTKKYFQSNFLNKINKIKFLSKFPKFDWSSYEHIHQLISMIPKAIAYKFSRLTDRKKEHQARWFAWNGRKPFDNVISEIRSKFSDI